MWAGFPEDSTTGGRINEKGLAAELHLHSLRRALYISVFNAHFATTPDPSPNFNL